jgi:ribosomal protein S18 acetylase RimI-like enzyme
MTYEIRAAHGDDREFLWQMLYYAAHMDESGEPPESARSNPDLRPYVEDFGRRGDIGVIAVDCASHAKAGAAWIRIMPAGWPLHHYVEATTPELAIAVAPEHLGHGAGSRMITQVLKAAAAIYPAVALSVRANNPARRLYERIGFAIIAEITNRVGGKSLIMRAKLSRPQK